jgi:hypothetical protein
MVNLKKSFEEAAEANDDKIVSAVVGHDERAEYESPEREIVTRPVQTWEEASKKIDYDYSNGFGGADCHAVIAWGEKFVYFVHEYDGATGINSVPRNPMECAPYWADVWKP